jgi:hypothetical protein
MGLRLYKSLLKFQFHLRCMVGLGFFFVQMIKFDALPSPELNPLEGPTMLSCGKLGLEGHSRLLALKRGRGAC